MTHRTLDRPGRTSTGLLLACTLAACAAPEKVGQPSTASQAEGRAGQRIECEGLERSILAVTPTRARMAEELGPPESITATTEPNRHVPGATDSLFVIRYPGMVVDLRAPAGGADMATQIRITASRHIRFPELGIGSSAARVVSALGEPTTRAADRIVYDCGRAVNQPVTFHLRDGVVAAVTIDYYVD